MNKNTFSPLGASNHSKKTRVNNDFYATDPIAIDKLHTTGLLDKDTLLWECACGDGRLSERLQHYGYNVVSTDLYDQGYGETGIDFLKQKGEQFCGDIITNPPFKQLTEFIIKGLELTSRKLFIFARIQTLESQSRYDKIFKNNPPSFCLPFVRRVRCYRGGGNLKNLQQFVMHGLYGINLMTRSVESDG